MTEFFVETRMKGATKKKVIKGVALVFWIFLLICMYAAFMYQVGLAWHVAGVLTISCGSCAFLLGFILIKLILDE